MLVRQNYYDEKRNKIKQRVLNVLHNLSQMTDYYNSYMEIPSIENREYILQIENNVDNNERKIEEHILEAISLQQLNLKETKWLLGMNRIIRELERVGDQIVNVVTISDINDVRVIKPLIRSFFNYEKVMIHWLLDGIENENKIALKNVLDHDHHVNQLNKGTYQELIDSINEQETITESRIKMIIISRFLERIGDHLVNIARTYLDLLNDSQRLKGN